MELTSADRKNFLIDELGFIRQQVKDAVNEARSLERHALVLTGAVWAWLLTGTDRDLPAIAWWIPCFLSVAILAREMVLYCEIRGLAAYIRQREKALLGEDGGWESEVWRSSWKIGALRVPGAAVLFWFLMIFGTATGPFWLIR